MVIPYITHYVLCSLFLWQISVTGYFFILQKAVDMLLDNEDKISVSAFICIETDECLRPLSP